jgi:hypothetical protein
MLASTAMPANSSAATLTATPVDILIYNDGQHTPASMNFINPLGATVIDADDLPIPGVVVTMAIESGSAILRQLSRVPASPDGQAASAMTDRNGAVVAVVAAGADPGPVVLSVRVTEPDGVDIVRYFHLIVDPPGSPPPAMPETGAGTRALEIAAFSFILVGLVLVSVATLARSKGRTVQ